jgi:arsenate reductase
MEIAPRRTTRVTCRRRAWALVVGVLTVASTGFMAQTSATQARSNTAKPPTVLFMCPHGAAKSVLASAYFQRLAKERGLNVRVTSAGTDPDAQVSSAVARHLENNGYEVPVTKPRLATAQDMATADVVISIGCDLKDLPAPRGMLVTWDDVPSPSEELQRADEKIRQRVTELVDELVRKQQKQ